MHVCVRVLWSVPFQCSSCLAFCTLFSRVLIIPLKAHVWLGRQSRQPAVTSRKELLLEENMWFRLQNKLADIWRVSRFVCPTRPVPARIARYAALEATTLPTDRQDLTDLFSEFLCLFWMEFKLIFSGKLSLLYGWRSYRRAVDTKKR